MQENNKEKDYSLIHKLLDGSISDNDLTRLNQWLEENPENLRLFDKENELWQESRVVLDDNIFNTDKSWTDISSRLGIGSNSTKLLSYFRRIDFRLLVAAAAIVILLVISTLSFWIGNISTLKQLAKLQTTVYTHNGEKVSLVLPDSTAVILNSGSLLVYDGVYNLKSRVVNLKGEAFFEVKTNPEKPFVVQIKGMKVIATGTQFNICSFDKDDRIEVTLEEGKLQIEIDGMKALNLNSGQQVVYFVKSKNILTQYVPIDTYSSWKEGKLRFIDTPLENVLRIIGRKYNVGFEVTSRDILGLKLTATIVDEPIEEVIKMFSTVSSLNFDFKPIDNEKSVQSKKRKIIVGKKKTN